MKITKTQLKQFLRNYDLGGLIAFQNIELGLMNKIFLLQAEKGNFILKILQQNNRGNLIDYELDLLNYLHDLPTPRPIALKNGKYSSRLGNNKAFLMTLLPGKHKKIITDYDLKDIGMFLAKLHNQTANFKSRIRRLETLSYSTVSLLEKFQKCRKIKDERIVPVLGYVKNNINNCLPPPHLPCGAIHSDLKPENCLFQKGKLTGVVDFDNSYIAPLVIDLANTMIWFCARGRRFDMEKAEIIAEAYQDSRRLDAAEKAYLPSAIHFVYLRNLLRGFEYFSLGKLKKEFIYWAIDEFWEAEQKLPINVLL